MVEILKRDFFKDSAIKFCIVHKERLELSRLIQALPPQDSVSSYSTTCTTTVKNILP